MVKVPLEGGEREWRSGRVEEWIEGGRRQEAGGRRQEAEGFFNWFLACRLGTHFRRLRLQWLDQRQQPLGIHSQPPGWERGDTSLDP